jgi:3,4-dihydroxy 2-butanone 4-phosphate synthase/GTP cyclohydrolase II
MSPATIPEILDELRAGRPIILIDDPGRENEGDLCIAAQFATKELVNFLLKARGLLCLALDGAICDRLGLSPQTPVNESKMGTAFTVTIGARHGVTTGISTADRAATIQAAVRDGAQPHDLVRPGHIQPLRARDGGVLVRAGHTEGIVDLCRLADLRPAGVICEILRDDGSLARMPDLLEFGRAHGIKVCTIADLVDYRRRRERLIDLVASARMPTRHGAFESFTYTSRVDGRTHVALTVGIEKPGEGGRFPPIAEPVLVRVHSQCLTGDVFGSLRCDCGEQLARAMQAIQHERLGVLLYISQEGRGIGLASKMQAYALQDQGLDTVEANQHLGFRPDEREFGTGAQILHDLGVRRLRLLTNNPKKLAALHGYGLEVTAQIPLVVDPNPHNEKYLQVKRDKLGHLFEPLLEGAGDPAGKKPT